jgi:hypothetical protein
MGWSPTNPGLGKDNQGDPQPLKVVRKNDLRGIGGGKKGGEENVVGGDSSESGAIAAEVEAEVQRKKVAQIKQSKEDATLTIATQRNDADWNETQRIRTILSSNLSEEEELLYVGLGLKGRF